MHSSTAPLSCSAAVAMAAPSDRSLQGSAGDRNPAPLLQRGRSLKSSPGLVAVLPCLQLVTVQRDGAAQPAGTDLISEARRNLVVPVNPRTAQQLLPDLRRLGQRIEGARLLPAQVADCCQEGLSMAQLRQPHMLLHR